MIGHARRRRVERDRQLAVPAAPAGSRGRGRDDVRTFGQRQRDAERCRSRRAPRSQLMVTVAVGSSTVPVTVVGLMFR